MYGKNIHIEKILGPVLIFGHKNVAHSKVFLTKTDSATKKTVCSWGGLKVFV